MQAANESSDELTIHCFQHYRLLENQHIPVIEIGFSSPRTFTMTES
jgi:hypothetical protein